MPNDSILSKIISNTPIALIVIGVFLILTGAAGGWPLLSLTVSDIWWRIALGVMGAVVGAAGYFEVRQRKTSEHNTNQSTFDCKHYGIRIKQPRSPEVIEVVDDPKDKAVTVPVHGQFHQVFDGDRFRLIVIDSANGFWPQSSTIVVEPHNRTWKGRVYLRGKFGSQYTIVIAHAGENTRLLCDYYRRVGSNAKYVSIRTMPKDYVACDSVEVSIKKKVA